jgi:hypothetical protein
MNNNNTEVMRLLPRLLQSPVAGRAGAAAADANNNGLYMPSFLKANDDVYGGLGPEPEDPVAFLKSLRFEVDVTKTPSSYMFAPHDDVARQIITVVAKNPDNTDYWRQVFYKSTGTGSHTKGTWYPISAIIGGEAGLLKKDSVSPMIFYDFDRLYRPEATVGRNDIRVRVKTISFLLAINELVEKDTFDIVLGKLEKIMEGNPSYRKQIGILQALADHFEERSTALIDTIPKEVVWIYDEPADYTTINNWIGIDNYTGLHPSARVRYGGGKRSKHPRYRHKTRKHSQTKRRHTKRRR